MLIQNFLNTGLTRLSTKPLAVSSVLINCSQVRYRKAVAFRKYVQPIFKKKVMLAVCEPMTPIDRRLPSEKCFNLTPTSQAPDHPYDVLLAKDMAVEIENSALVCFFHQNKMPSSQKRLLSNEFEHEGMTLRYYNRDIARLCFANTRYSPLMHFASCYDFTVLFAPDTRKISKIIRISKKYSDVFLLGAMVDRRRLLTLKQLEEFDKMGDLDTQRAMLYHTLTLPQQGLVQSLNFHSSQLSLLLNTYANPSGEAMALEDDKKE